MAVGLTPSKRRNHLLSLVAMAITGNSFCRSQCIIVAHVKLDQAAAARETVGDGNIGAFAIETRLMKQQRRKAKQKRTHFVG